MQEFAILAAYATKNNRKVFFLRAFVRNFYFRVFYLSSFLDCVCIRSIFLSRSLSRIRMVHSQKVGTSAVFTSRCDSFYSSGLWPYFGTRSDGFQPKPECLFQSCK